ncbi:MAG: GNAT family N-acetyltransferase [Patescibacteria group bacterium]
MNELTVVENEKKYWEFIRKLRNDQHIKRGFIEQQNITKAQQEKYMEKNGKFFYICLVDGEPAGYIGIIDDDIRIATHPNFQGRGVALFMVDYVKNKFKNLQAKIKVENTASIKLFKKAGFKLKYYIYEN